MNDASGSLSSRSHPNTTSANNYHCAVCATERIWPGKRKSARQLLYTGYDNVNRIGTDDPRHTSSDRRRCSASPRRIRRQLRLSFCRKYPQAGQLSKIGAGHEAVCVRFVVARSRSSASSRVTLSAQTWRLQPVKRHALSLARELRDQDDSHAYASVQRNVARLRFSDGFRKVEPRGFSSREIPLVACIAVLPGILR